MPTSSLQPDHPGPRASGYRRDPACRPVAVITRSSAVKGCALPVAWWGWQPVRAGVSGRIAVVDGLATLGRPRAPGQACRRRSSTRRRHVRHTMRVGRDMPGVVNPHTTRGPVRVVSVVVLQRTDRVALIGLFAADNGLGCSRNAHHCGENAYRRSRGYSRFHDSLSVSRRASQVHSPARASSGTAQTRAWVNSVPGRAVRTSNQASIPMSAATAEADRRARTSPR